MPDNHLLEADDAMNVGARLIDTLHRWRDVDGAAAAGPAVPAQRAIEANRAIVEHAKGALMLRYGIDSYQAFAVIVRWAHASHTPVHTIADTLVHGICEGNPQTELRHRPLMRWLEDQLRHNDPGLDRRGSPAWAPAGG